MRVIVTRPLREAQRWVGLLQARGFDALALPLIDIAPALDPQPLRQAWARLDTYAAVMFVSANAVEQFFGADAREGLAGLSPAGASAPRAWATGPGTLQALLDAGVAAERIDAPPADAPQFDSEALWQVVGPALAPGARVLIVRGSDAQGANAGRDWLARQLEAHGARADIVLAYRRERPRWTEAQQLVAAGAAGAGAVWLFSSSEAVQNLCALLPGQDWGQALAVATHPRIAQAARQAGFGVVCESRPGLAHVVASIESAQ